ncbi:unnamed protein product [Meganyctiphanes norvegica]|uniref:Uncharacterized protein n=1 Tax=Meganyctiphanes norvegica TaxID=48144 RepID=A0AAV2R7S7_MEGNR
MENPNSASTDTVILSTAPVTTSAPETTGASETTGTLDTTGTLEEVIDNSHQSITLDSISVANKQTEENKKTKCLQEQGIAPKESSEFKKISIDSSKELAGVTGGTIGKIEEIMNNSIRHMTSEYITEANKQSEEREMSKCLEERGVSSNDLSKWKELCRNSQKERKCILMSFSDMMSEGLPIKYHDLQRAKVKYNIEENEQHNLGIIDDILEKCSNAKNVEFGFYAGLSI